MQFSKKIKLQFIYCVFLLLLMVIGVSSHFTPNSFSAFNTIESVWSGEIATSFDGGNGTVENPFQITNGEQLAYFKYVIENENSLYKDKYYVLVNNINLGNLIFDPIGNKDNYFSGQIDGQGYTISNAKIDQYIDIDNKYYSGLFTKIENATIKNININNISISLNENKNSYIALLAADATSSKITNISLKQSNIVINNQLNKENVYIGGLIVNAKKSEISNIYLDFDTNSKTKNIASLITNSTDNKFNNIIIDSSVEQYSLSNISSKTIYKKEELNNDLTDTLNKNIMGNYYWINDNGTYYLYREVDLLSKEEIDIKDVNATITPHDSGVVDGIVYVNDFDADKNYYLGLNYTTNTSGTLPTTQSKNLYNDNNLVRVQITYDSSSMSNGTEIKGTVSTTELEDKFIYYKTYPVNNNGTSSLTDDYVKIELIDNPFTNRPSGYGFNGWYTNYSGAKISIDTTIYVRYVEIPVTYTNNIPEDIVIDFNARWTKADVSYVESNSTNNLTNAINGFNDASIQKLETQIEHRHETPIYGDKYDIDMTGYYITASLNAWNRYPTGSRDANGNTLSGWCTNWGGCDYYEQINGETYRDGITYYEWTGSSWVVVDINTFDPPIIDYEVSYTYTDLLSNTDNMSTFFEQVTISRGNSYAGYFNASGELQESGTCNTNGGCTYYKLIQYYDENGNQNTYQSSKSYYYLVTRDTNIIVLTTDLTGSWASNQTKPLTFTGSYGGIKYDVRWTVSGTYVNANDDLVIENMEIYANRTAAETNPTGSNNQSRYLYGNWNNVKIGRGITRTANNQVNFISAMGGNNTATGSSSNITNYRFMVESGFFSSLSVTGGTSGRNVYINGEAIYGNDYDRVKKDNDKLDVYFCASGSWGNNVYKSGATSIAMHTLVKSGKYGSARPTNVNNNDSAYSYGIYVGGRQGGDNYTAREGIIEGGWVYNLIGGPLAQSGNANYNDSYIYVKGGEVDVIIGGAGRTTTYGNRIIQVTGGTINYSIFGGSNGVTSSSSGDQAGTLDGTPYIYVGGNAQIGSETNVTNNATLFGFEAGSVFGIGNGQSGVGTIGTAENSYIIIDGNANILRNVYGGGNFGAVGINSNASTSTTEINILGGTVHGGVFGGGNRNGSGSTSKTATITINQKGGTVGNIYGGANELGTIYGGVYINSLGGTVTNDIYGGGYGGLSNTSNGTYVRDAINIKIGDTSDSIVPTIEGSVYGGSAFGSVNGTSNSTNVSSNGVNIVVNEGTIKTSLFGGGKGNNTYTPYVMGDILITVNGGNISDIFGGNDAAGTPNGEVEIHLKGGTIGRTFGGGNNASVKTNYIYLEGSTCTSIFGGSNASGTVTTSNIKTTSGTVDTIYGGNNTAGNTITSNITIDGGTIQTAVYGGGNLAETGTTNVTLNKSVIPNVYGGGANANVTSSTNIQLNGSSVGNLYGGSNAGGNVPVSTILLNKGSATNVFGGNNEAGITTTTNITLNNGTIGSIYGGGNNVGVTTSNINLGRGKVDNVYGGSNKLGDVINTNITTIENASNETDLSDKDLAMTVEASESYDVDPYTSSSKIYVTIINNTSVAITNWDAVITTTQTALANNWSQSKITLSSNKFIIDETNQYYGTNTIPANGSYSFEFFTGNSYEHSDFKVLDFSIVGIDSNGNEYSFDSNEETDINGSLIIGELFGGNNLGGTTITPRITLNKGTYNNIYGGGNQAVTNGSPILNISNINVNNSIYGGGNQAAVLGNTTVNVHGNTIVSKNIFGGGNHGAIGEDGVDSSTSTVNIVGATVGGSVYGGCNTSIVYGVTKVNIGKNAISGNNNLTTGNIKISGTVFGGGEANESGSEDYDFSFISVTKGIDILIDGTGYENNNLTFAMNGSIFGSGNASSSAGPSNIYIRKLGTRENPNSSVSIQRADEVVVDNSAIELIGTTDRTNDYSTIKYSLNRIKVLKVKNTATLLLRENANMLESFYSLVDENGSEVKATVEIDDENKTVTRNVDNRLYLLGGKNLNVTTNQNATAYGIVSGMTFLGMYQQYSAGGYVYGLYGEDFSYGSDITSSDIITGGSYVLGLHNVNHDITVDGFYTNYADDEYTTLTTAYVEPTPPDSNYYMWIIGTASVNYSFNITASKYSSLGTYELSMKDFSKGNTIFNVIGFTADGLKNGVSLKDATEVPKLAASQEEANSIIGLAMKTETTEWTIHETTKFYKNPDSSYTGNLTYSTDNQTVAPSLMFYLYHAKNISADQELGTVIIYLQALEPKNEIEYETQLISIYVTIDTKYYDDADAYDASITYGKKYEMPSATNVNITNKSQFTAYYSLFAEVDDETKNTFYGANKNYYHTLVSNYVFPVGTKITMIDIGANEINPKYYYYVVNESNYQTKLNELNQDSEVTYRLSDFIKMDSIDTNNTYKDQENNDIYLHEDINYVMEEFIFIFDFKETTSQGEQLEKSILFELRNTEDRTILSVLGIRQNLMNYNLYETSNVVLSERLTVDSEYLYYNTDKDTTYRTSIEYNQTELRESIVDTNYESSSMGINITFYDNTNSLVSSSQLSSTTITIDGKTHYVDSNGVFRIKLSDKVSNLTKTMKLYTGISLPTGTYTMKIALFASNDGLHNSSDKEATIIEQQIVVVGNENLILVDIDDASQLIIGETGLNMNDSPDEKFTITYSSVLENPNIRLAIYRRDTSSAITNDYIEYNAKDLFYSSFSFPQPPLASQSPYEYIISTTPKATMEFTFKLKEKLESGTYRFVFMLYDGNQLIDEDYKYIIIRKNV